MSGSDNEDAPAALPTRSQNAKASRKPGSTAGSEDGHAAKSGRPRSTSGSGYGDTEGAEGSEEGAEREEGDEDSPATSKALADKALPGKPGLIWCERL